MWKQSKTQEPAALEKARTEMGAVQQQKYLNKALENISSVLRERFLTGKQQDSTEFKVFELKTF